MIIQALTVKSIPFSIFPPVVFDSLINLKNEKLRAFFMPLPEFFLLLIATTKDPQSFSFILSPRMINIHPLE
jgi:hypothetical protein